MFPNPSNNRPVQLLNGRVLMKNSFMEGSLQADEFYLTRTIGSIRASPGAAWIVAPVIGTMLLASLTMWAVFVKQDRQRHLESAGGLVEQSRA